MGMRIGGASGAWASHNTSAVQNVQQRQQGMKDLFSALKTGDLDAAQQAFAAVAKVTQIDPNSSLGQLGQALGKGDVGGAQKIATSMHQHQARSAPAQSSSALAALQGLGASVNMLA